MKAIRSKCRQKANPITDDNQRLVRHVYRAEQLVFAKLKHLQRREIKCQGCEKTHVEWFKVDEAKALEVIETVRKYMEEDYGVAKEDEKVRPPKSQRLEEKGTELNPRQSRPINSL